MAWNVNKFDVVHLQVEWPIYRVSKQYAHRSDERARHQYLILDVPTTASPYKLVEWHLQAGHMETPHFNIVLRDGQLLVTQYWPATITQLWI